MRVELPSYLSAMVRRSPPVLAPVVPGSTPVIAFGDPSRAEVASLGINPSKREFVEAGAMLAGDERRLATLDSLGADHLASLTDEQVREVVADCARYFQHNPYRRWFDPLDRLLCDGLGASFYDGSACHLDLVQWATDPVWSEIRNRTVRELLLDDGVAHLREQLRRENIRLVVLNGRAVLKQVDETGLATLTKVGTLPVGSTTCTLYAGKGESARFLGWSTNLQTSFGVSHEFRDALAGWLQEQDPALKPSPTHEQSVGVSSLDGSGHLMEGTIVQSKQAFAELLDGWLHTSKAQTIGDVGSFGGRPYVHIELGDVTAVLNADTKQAAVREYLDEVGRRGDAEAPWQVVANQRGRVNKIVFRDDGQPTPGWFCYLAEPLTTPGEI
jgi:hypothetical protein